MPKAVPLLFVLLLPLPAIPAITQTSEGAASPVVSCRTGTHDYRISRKGDSKGLMSVSISRDGSLCRIEVREWLEDTHYCHQIYRRETWEGRDLVDYLSMTKGWCGVLAKLHDAAACRWNPDGSPIEVTARRVDDKIEIHTSERSAKYPAGVTTMTFLGPRYPIGSSTLSIIDPLRGGVTQTKITKLESHADKTIYEVAGDRLSTLEYDRDHMLSKLVIDGGIGGDVKFDLLSSNGEQPVAEEPECEAVFDPLQAR